MDRQFLLDMAAAYRLSTTRQNKAHAAACEALADRAYPVVVAVPPVVAPPVVALPPVVVPPTPLGVLPPLAQCGPREPLAANLTTDIASGNYAGQRFGVVTLTQPGVYTFTDCELSFSVVFPGRTVTLDHCKVNGGIWFEDASGVGGHAGWTIKSSTVVGGQGQALRPKGPGTIHISDSWLCTYGTPIGTGIHTETMQCMFGANVIADRVAFSCEPRWHGADTPITAVQTFESGLDGAGSTFTDCTFGYWDGAGWSIGGGYYAIYNAHAAYVRPTIYHGGANYWYNNTPPATLVGPVYL